MRTRSLLAAGFIVLGLATLPLLASAQNRQAMQQVIELNRQAMEAYGQLAQKNNTMIVPGNMTEVSGLIATAMALIKGGTAGK